MQDGLLKRLAETFKPELFVNHYGSSEVYTFAIDQDATRKAGQRRARRHQHPPARGVPHRGVAGQDRSQRARKARSSAT